ncbi:Uncharacterised protein [Mycobacteroides abscessus subsp. abscessus]|nr:Uncharacterised protein [Mycobacteroides abscessus subsp. abscessus]
MSCPAPELGSRSSAPGEVRTACIRWATVTKLATASTHIAVCSGHCTPNPPLNIAPASTMMSRSGRSMRPPSARNPEASARAFTYEITCEVIMQISVATTKEVDPQPNAAHQTSPANTAPSATRSHVASSTAPNRVPPPRARAIAPSSMSNIANNHTAMPPQKRCPVGKSVSAATTDAAVPKMVTVSGVNPARNSALASGLVIFANVSRESRPLMATAPRRWRAACGCLAAAAAVPWSRR